MPQEHVLGAKEVRREAWRKFYREQYIHSVEQVGNVKKDIDAYITGLWKSVGRKKRDEYTRAVRVELEGKGKAGGVENGGEDKENGRLRQNGMVKQNEEQMRVEMNGNAAGEEIEEKAKENDAEMKDKVGGDAEETAHASMHVSPKRPEAKSAAKDDDEIQVVPVSSKSSKPRPNSSSAAPKRPRADSEWPRKLISRLCTGSMLKPGKGILRTNDELTLSVPPVRAQKGRNKKQSPPIVRFSKAGREVGKISSDVGNALALAMQSQFVHATCKVVSAPRVVRMFEEIFLEISIYITKEAFEGDAKKVEAGLGGEEGGEGVDAGRMHVVHMISALKLCEPPKEPGIDFSPGGEEGDPGAVNEESAENYYKTVEAIDETESNDFQPPKNLTCTLREYQRVGVRWMVAREKHGAMAQLKEMDSVDFMIDPLWKKRVFPDGDVFYMNPTTGGLSIVAPVGGGGGPWGGILADEMGLGKTVQCIACIVHDLEERLKIANGNVDEKSGSAEGGTDEVETNEVSEVQRKKGSEHDAEAQESSDDDLVEVTVVRREQQSRKRVNHLTDDELTVDEPLVGNEMEETDNENDESRDQVDVEKSTDSTESGQALRRQRSPPSDIETMETRRATQASAMSSRGSRRLRSSVEENDEIETERFTQASGKSARGTSRLGKNSKKRRSLFCSDDEDEDGDEGDDDGDTDWNEENSRSAKKKASGPDSRSADDDDDFFNSPVRKRHRNSGPKRQKVKGLSKPSAVSLLMSKAAKKGSTSGGTLIVCPMSLITQWMNELSLHVSPNFLRTTAHYGTARGDADSISVRYADVVVTSYGVLASEYAGEPDKDETDDSTIGGPIFKLRWHRVILDEAHTIKSRTTRWARAAYGVNAEKRWCVTGTVIHNHVNDVFSLLHFLQVKPWSSWAFWNRGVVTNLESKDVAMQKTAMSLIRDIISSITLRRKKTTKDSSGKCIVQLTKKTVEIVRLVPSLEERDFYMALHERSKLQFDTFLAKGNVLKNFASVLELLLRLRQACDHPYLVFAAAPGKDSAVMKDKDKLFKQFIEAGASSQYVEDILNKAESGELAKTTQCPLCLDVMDDPVAPRECGHPGCRMCLMEAIKRAKKCPVCRVAIDKDSIATLPRSSRFSVDLEAKWRSSAKIDALLKEVKGRQAARRRDGGQAVGKTVIFSQFTSMLDLVGIALDREKFQTLRIDGSVSQAQRAIILEQFETEDELSKNTANILLVSLRAGGVGLNLVAASHAILLDIHWNPQVDAQAQDRIHRHGQTRDVVIRRYIIKDTVEEKLLKVQDRKQDIADGALGVATEEDKKQARISELKLLFSSG